MVKLNGSLAVQDYATPANWVGLNNSGTDFRLGAGPSCCRRTMRSGWVRTGLALSGLTSTTWGQVGNFVRVSQAQTPGDTVGKSPVYWEGPAKKYLFVLHSNSATKSFEFTGTNIITTPLGTSSFTNTDRCGGISLSSMGATNGILWEIGSDSNLRAYDAVNFSECAVERGAWEWP